LGFVGLAKPLACASTSSFVVVLVAFGRRASKFRLDLFGVVPQGTLEDMGLEILVLVIVRLQLPEPPSYWERAAAASVSLLPTGFRGMDRNYGGGLPSFPASAR
jgi:hypothetical protein